MTTTPTQAARVRSQVDHPIIDADGHFVELGPLLQDEVISYVEDTGGRGAARAIPRHRRESFDTSSSLADRGDPDRAATSGRRCRRGGAGRRPACATAPPSHLPALLYERLDEIGIDFTILYPSMALGYFEITDEELSSVRVSRGEPLPPAPVRAVPRPLHGGRADPDEHARAGGRRGAVRGRASWARSRCSWRATRAVRSTPAGTASTCSASTATTTTTRCGRRAWSSASRPWCTARCSSTA